MPKPVTAKREPRPVQIDLFTSKPIVVPKPYVQKCETADGKKYQLAAHVVPAKNGRYLGRLVIIYYFYEWGGRYHRRVIKAPETFSRPDACAEWGRTRVDNFVKFNDGK